MHIGDLFIRCVIGMTEMKKKMERRVWEELPEIHRLAVILVICVITGSNDYATHFNMNWWMK